jgi:hypothetical protein
MGLNKKSPHNIMTKHEATPETELMEHVIEAIAYMEYQPSTALNIKCRKQLRLVWTYLKAIDQERKATSND